MPPLRGREIPFQKVAILAEGPIREALGGSPAIRMKLGGVTLE